jgi:hypothetical protein
MACRASPGRWFLHRARLGDCRDGSALISQATGAPSRKRGLSRCCEAVLGNTGQTDLVAEIPHVRKDPSPPAATCRSPAARPTCPLDEPCFRSCAAEPSQLPDHVPLARVHPLDLGVIVEHLDAAAAHRGAAQPRHEEQHIRLERPCR